MKIHHLVFGPPEKKAAERLIRLSLEEDHARDDCTSRLAIPPDLRGRAILRNRQRGIIAGLPCVPITLDLLEGEVDVEILEADGKLLDTGRELAVLEGSLRTILAAERTFLNLLGFLSGCATMTHRFVGAAGPDCTVLDTRKTWPGGRILQKYAVRCGGGENHRMDLSDGILLKDNHRWGGFQMEDLILRARQDYPDHMLVVEVDTFEQLEEILPMVPDRILLDNFGPRQIEQAVRLRRQLGNQVKFEVSGGVNLESVGAIARAGADYVSVGALTHSAPSLDIGLDLELEDAA